MTTTVDQGVKKTAISVTNIRKSFHGQEILKGIDLTVDRGSHVAVIGPSGSGKSTFIRCLNLLEQPEEGNIVLNGKEVFSAANPPGQAQIRELRKQVGIVFQSFNLFTTHTALANVSIGQRYTLNRNREEANTRSEALLEKVGMKKHMHKYPSQLSGGQQQRVAIARSLALDPKVMLFDEPTSAIDPEMRVEVLQVMKDLAEAGMTMIVVTHELDFAEKAADKIAFLDEGKLLEYGTPDQIFNHSVNPRTTKFLNAVTGGF